MNEFTAKKLGEVLAFSIVGVETLERGREAFLKIFSPEKIEKLLQENTHFSKAITDIANTNNIFDIVSRKAEATSKKLKEMRDLYVKDEWDNPTELLEWLGFFGGGAIVHASLIKGVSEQLEHEEMKTLSGAIFSFHSDLLDIVSEMLSQNGAKRAKE